ncbi:MAG: hypothetical protein IID36_12440 [Planctomycetes bacterium]|nr:hypothetical protein [Planctomycetota bacterium]
MRTIAWLIPMGVVVTVGCSAAVRDRLAHFFFEIPDARSPAPAFDSSDDVAVGAAPDRPRLVLPPEKYKSVHPPVVMRQCDACHRTDRRMTVPDDTRTTCGQCHEDYFGDEVGHAPVSIGECLTCHKPHRSEFEHLLTMGVGDLCIECHDEAEDLSEDAHSRDGVEHCTTCHDPHFGAPPFIKTGVPD